MSTGQGCKLYFGSSHDPLRYAPDGYKGMSSLTNPSVTLVLPPPHIKIPTPVEPGSRSSSRNSSCVTSSTESLATEAAAGVDEAIAIASPEECPNKLRNNDNDSSSTISSVNNEGNVEPNLIPVDRVPPWEETPHTAREHINAHNTPELDIFSNINDDIIPSLYFEVEIGFQRMTELDFSDDDTKW